MLLRIGSCEIDCERRRILREGEERPLSRKAFDLLVVLLDERPKVVSKERLIRKIWANTFVADANLAILIGDVRAALGDSAQEPHMIKTHHRVGYSFVGEITEITSGSPAMDRQPAFVLVSGKRRILLFDGTTAMLGRDATCEIVIDHPSVSRFHARLSVAGEVLSVEDNDSKNGTRVDGRKLTEPSVVRSGQKLMFGTLEATVVGGSALAGSTMTAQDE
jgi:DNA-binding winged helix-turn-helix (wHTH) protein